MKRLSTIAAVPALALSLALAAPALAQQAAGPQAGTPALAAPEASGQRMVSGRNLMTAAERASFRSQMQQAAPDQRQRLWDQKRTELAQRATQRGLVLAEPGARPGATAGERGEGRPGGRGDAGGSMMSRMMRWSPRAP